MHFKRISNKRCGNYRNSHSRTKRQLMKVTSSSWRLVWCRSFCMHTSVVAITPKKTFGCNGEKKTKNLKKSLCQLVFFIHCDANTMTDTTTDSDRWNGSNAVKLSFEYLSCWGETRGQSMEHDEWISHVADLRWLLWLKMLIFYMHHLER